MLSATCEAIAIRSPHTATQTVTLHVATRERTRAATKTQCNQDEYINDKINFEKEESHVSSLPCL